MGWPTLLPSQVAEVCEFTCGVEVGPTPSKYGHLAARRRGPAMGKPKAKERDQTELAVATVAVPEPSAGDAISQGESARAFPLLQCSGACASSALQLEVPLPPR